MANALVSSWLDYCNSSFGGVSLSSIYVNNNVYNILQLELYETLVYQYTPVLMELYWLPVEQHAMLKKQYTVYDTETQTSIVCVGKVSYY